MSYTHILPRHQNLEALRAELEGMTCRSAYIVASSPVPNSPNIRFRLPGGTTYERRSTLSIYLAGLDTNYCVKREQVDGNSANDIYYYDLEPDTLVRLAFPRLPSDNPAAWGVFFNRVGLKREKSYRGVPVDPATLPEEFREYLIDAVDTKVYAHRKDTPYVTFHVTEYIENPFVRQPEWWLGKEENKNEEEAHRRLMPPGHYHHPERSTTSGATYAIAIRDPGPCVVCRGASKAKEHLGIHDNGYFTSPVCVACLPEALTRWAELLRQ